MNNKYIKEVMVINTTIENEIGKLSSAVNRITGLYQNWAVENGVLYGVVQVLYVLYFYDAATQKQISETCEIPKQTVNNVIRQFKKDNYITLISDSADKRQKNIVLTQSGREYAKNTLAPFFQLNGKVFDKVGSELLHELVKSLTTFGDAMEMEMELIKVSLKWESKTKKISDDMAD